jgi:ADP-ribosylglycohydrolase
MNLKEKILGCLLGAAIGDAMGAATEMRTTEQIKEFFGEKVTTFIAPPMDTFARGNKPGQVTDDFSIAYVAIETILENGKINDEVAKEALLRWGDIEEFFSRFAGPTTRAAIEALRTGVPVEDKWGFKLVCENDKATNGAAMKASPLATLSLGDVDKAFMNSMILSMPTHDNNTALSGAALVACATATALNEGSTLDDILESALEGAKKGDDYGRKNAKTLSNPSVYEKSKLAIAYAANSENMDDLIEIVADIVGTSVYAYDSVPAAIAFVAKLKDDPMEPIIAAVNVGNDTDSIATIVGGIAGALLGYKAFPSEYLDIINEANGYDLEKLAEEIIEKSEVL